jgi:hypothetical protein
MLIIFKVSETEIKRREEAFLVLSVSLFLGFIFASILFNFPISYIFFGLFALALFLVNFWLKKFFNKFLKMKTYLSKEFLIRGTKKFLIKNIRKIKIKKTTNNTIREIGVFFDDGKSLFINGISDFEKLKINLLKNVGKNVAVKNTYEPMDFDSVFFYPILGLILSFGTVYLLKLMAGFSYQTMKIILYVSTIYVFLVGVYFVVSKPISKRY